jgi:hypothetical protein
MKQRGKPWEEAWGKACPKASRKPRGNQEQEQKQEQEQSIEERAMPAAHPPRVDRFLATFAKPSESAVELFEAWKLGASKPNATLDAKRAEFFGRLALEGVTPEQVADCMRGAKLDPWALSTGLAATAILGSAEQREKFAGLTKAPESRISPEPVRRTITYEDLTPTREQTLERARLLREAKARGAAEQAAKAALSAGCPPVAIGAQNEATTPEAPRQ